MVVCQIGYKLWAKFMTIVDVLPEINSFMVGAYSNLQLCHKVQGNILWGERSWSLLHPSDDAILVPTHLNEPWAAFLGLT